MLIDHLPRDAALWRSKDPDAVAWTVGDHLLAHLIDAVTQGNWQRSGGKKRDLPARFPRPGDASARRRLSPSEMARRLAEQRLRRGR